MAGVSHRIEIACSCCTDTTLARLCALNLRKAPCINGISSVTLPSGADLTSIFGEVWVLYPSAPHPVPLSHGVTFCALASFRALLCDLACINAASASSSSSVQLHLLLSLRSRLQDWVLALPEPVQAERIVYPSHLKMQYVFGFTSIHSWTGVHDLCVLTFDAVVVRTFITRSLPC